MKQFTSAHPLCVVRVNLLAIFEKYPELKDDKVKFNGERVVEFPKLPKLQQITLKALRWGERDKRLIIREAGRVN